MMIIDRITGLYNYFQLCLSDQNRWIREYLSDTDIIYIGYIDGDISDIEHLRKLGVTGPMILVNETISKCIVTRELGKKLFREYDGFFPGVFTGVDKYGRQVAWGTDDFKDD